MKKKWTALLLAMLLSLSILTSCGSGEHTLRTVDGAPSNSQMVAEQPANTTESDEDVSGGGSQTPPEMTGPVWTMRAQKPYLLSRKCRPTMGSPMLQSMGIRLILQMMT